MLRIGSLFAGIGGLELGLESCGLGPVIWQAERDPYAYDVLAHHWPTVRRYRDVRHIDEQAERPEVICGGFPCQDLSVAGKGAGIDGKRSGLWREFARVVGVLRPRYVFVENVAALARRGLDRVVGDMASLGFNAEWDCFTGTDVGAPQVGPRLFVLASTDGGRREVGWGSEPGRLEGARGRESHGRGACVGGEALGRGVQARGRFNGFPPGPDAIEWTGPEPAVRRGAHGTARRMDRLRCLGNAALPQVAALAWRTLSARAAGGIC